MPADAVERGIEVSLGKLPARDDSDRLPSPRSHSACMRNGQTPHAPIEAGYQHAVAVIMAMKAFDTGKRHVYDDEKRGIREG